MNEVKTLIIVLSFFLFSFIVYTSLRAEYLRKETDKKIEQYINELLEKDKRQ